MLPVIPRKVTSTVCVFCTMKTINATASRAPTHTVTQITPVRVRGTDGRAGGGGGGATWPRCCGATGGGPPAVGP
ncbi:hypothetical protein GCM10010531_35670 [Blastococcus jejuensis]|uniref:Secreted protein n=1 Tax=Blastococcus jejuensis TaxID=351224 RepID=A0ABP6PH61_9ACTN